MKPFEMAGSRQVLLPHLEAIAQKMEAGWRAGELSPGERAYFSDALIAAVCGQPDARLQAQVHSLTIYVRV